MRSLNTAASVTVLQVGLSQVSTDLAGVRGEIADLRREVRNGLEVAV